jgi:hypothetical protein
MTTTGHRLKRTGFWRTQGILSLMATAAAVWLGGCTASPAGRQVQGLTHDEIARSVAQLGTVERDELWIIERSSDLHVERPWRAAGTAAMTAVPESAAVTSLVLRERDGTVSLLQPGRTAVHAAIREGVARVHIAQQFQSTASTDADAEYTVSLGIHAEVSEFIMTLGERRIRAIIRDRGQAEALYREAVARGYSASKLTTDHAGFFRASIAGVPGGAAIGVDLRYFQPLMRSGEAHEFAVPLRAITGNETGLASLSMVVELDSVRRMDDVQVSHDMLAKWTLEGLSLQLAAGGGGSSDFVLRYIPGSASAGGPRPGSRPAEFDRMALEQGLLRPGTAFVAVDALSRSGGERVIGPSAPIGEVVR